MEKTKKNMKDKPFGFSITVSTHTHTKLEFIGVFFRPPLRPPQKMHKIATGQKDEARSKDREREREKKKKG